MSAPAATTAAAGDEAVQERWVRRVRALVAATIAYNVVEAVVALVAGHRASSSALVGFGLDSLVEVSSAAAVAWQFSARDPAVRAAREQRTLRVVALSFLALAAYVGVDSVTALAGGRSADESPVGLVLAALSVVVMPVLSLAQRRAGRRLGSVSAVADSHQTLLCTYLSAALLVGLGLNAALGWTWADPVAALVIAAVALREGVSAWRGEGCCAPAPTTGGSSSGSGGGRADGSCGGGCSCCAPVRTDAVGRWP